YCFELREGLCVDATNSGNISRFANHSCEPNCEAKLWMDDGQPTVTLKATWNICKGDQICIDY
ncbi:hypothetical protein BKA56DRAFT_447524, partial [Ilyonectria sp. MPI-CAGE-AT-0026]